MPKASDACDATTGKKEQTDMPALTIDNRKIEVPAGTNLLEAARLAGIKIPSLCYLKNVQAIGSCRDRKSVV